MEQLAVEFVDVHLLARRQELNDEIKRVDFSASFFGSAFIGASRSPCPEVVAAHQRLLRFFKNLSIQSEIAPESEGKKNGQNKPWSAPDYHQELLKRVEFKSPMDSP